MANIGEISATLTAEDRMSAAIEAAIQRVERSLTKVAESAEKNMGQLRGSTDRAAASVNRAARDTGESLERMERRMTLAATAGSFLGNTLAGAFTSSIGFIKDLATNSIMAGARLEQLSGVSVFLGERAGYTAQYVNDLAAKIEKTGITGTDSRNAIVQLLGAHIDLAKATELSAVAQNMATISGESSSETYSRIIRGITTLQPEILKTAGFTINLETAMRDYSETTGKSAANLSGQERQQILLNAVLKEGAEKAGLYGISMEYAGKQAGSAERAWAQVSEQLGTIMLPITSRVIKAYYELGSSVRDSVIDAGGEVKQWVAEVGESLGEMITKTGQVASSTVQMARDLYGAWKDLPPLYKSLAETAGIAAVSIWALNAASGALVKTQLYTWAEAGIKSIYTLHVMVQAFGWGALAELTVLKIKAAVSSLWLVLQNHPWVALATAIGLATTALTKWYVATKEAELAAQELGARQDAIARAASRSEKNASLIAQEKTETEKYNLALKLNDEWHQRLIDPMARVADKLSELSRMNGTAAEKAKLLNDSIVELSNKGELTNTRMQELAKTARELGIPLSALPPALQNMVTGLDNVARASEKKGVGSFSEQLAAANAELKALDPMKLQDISTAILSGAIGVEQLKKESGLTDIALKILTDRLKDTGSATKKVGDEAAKAAKEIKDITTAWAESEQQTGRLTGAQQELIQSHLDLNHSMSDVAKVTKISEAAIKAYADTVKQTVDDIEAFRKVGDTAAVTVARGFAGMPNVLIHMGQAMHGVNKNTGELEANFRLLGTNVPPVGQLITDRVTGLKGAVTETNQSLSVLAQGFVNMAQAAGGSIGSVIGAIGQMIAALDLANKATTGPNGERTGNWGVASGIFNRNASRTERVTSAVASAGAIYQGASNIWEATGSHRSTGGNALGGALAGAQAGAMFGPYGIAIGAAAGLIVGLIRGKPEWAKAADEVGRDFGVKISDALAKEIAKSAKEDYGGSRQAASIAHLSDIVKEAGGLTAKNVDQLTARLRDTFSMVATHQMTIAQGAKVIEENFAQFAEAGTDSMGFLSKAMREVIALDREMGLNTQAVTDYLLKQGAAAIDASNAIMSSLDTQLPAWVKNRQVVDELNDAWNEIAANTAPDKMADAFDRFWNSDNAKNANAFAEAMTHLMDAADSASQELENLGVIAVSTFAAAVAAGVPYAEALARASNGLSKLSLAYEALGLPIENMALKSLMAQTRMLEGNQNLITAVGGLGDALVAMSNMGLLNVDTFRSMEETGATMYTRLQAAAAAAGGGTREALLPMQDFLHRAAKAAEELGIPLDENTAMLIGQSKELGIWKEKGIDPMIAAMDTLIDKMGDLIDVLSNVRFPQPPDYSRTGLPSGGGNTPTGPVGDDNPGAQALRAGSAYSSGRFDVVSSSSVGNAASLNTSSGPMVVQVMMHDGRVLAEAIVPELPGAMNRYGLGR